MSTAEGVTVAPARMLGGVTGGVPSSIWVACSISDCLAFGVQRQVFLRQVTIGVIGLPDLYCARCGNRIAVPNLYILTTLQEEPMPKLHVGREPTYKENIRPPVDPAVSDAIFDAVVGDTVVEVAAEEPEPADPPQETAARRPRKPTGRKAK